MEFFHRLSHLRTDSLAAYVTSLGFYAWQLSQHVSQLNSIFKHGIHLSEHSGNAAPERLLVCSLTNYQSRHR